MLAACGDSDDAPAVPASSPTQPAATAEQVTEAPLVVAPVFADGLSQPAGIAQLADGRVLVVDGGQILAFEPQTP